MSEKQIVKNLDFAAYRAKLDYISVSELKSYIDSPYSYYKRYIQGIRDTDKSSAMTFGSLVHCLVLEPELFDKEYFVTEVRKDQRTKIYQEVLKEAGSRACISPAELERARQCAETARPLILEYGSDFQSELSLFYQGPRGFLGMKAKARLDGWAPSSEIIVDVKTTNTLPTYEAVIKTIFNFNYHLQIAWYMDIWKATTGRLPKGFEFIFVQSEFPYASVKYKVGRDIIQFGRDEYKRHLMDLREIITNPVIENFPRIRKQKLVLQLPPWKQKTKFKDVRL